MSVFDLTVVQHEVALRLARHGIQSRFVTTDRHWAEWLVARGVPREHILDLARTAPPARVQGPLLGDLQAAEARSRITLHQAMLMDPFRRWRTPEEMEAYACMCWQEIRTFFREHGITHVVAEPSALASFVAYLLCNLDGRHFVVPRDMRHPSGRILFFADPYQDRPYEVPTDDGPPAARDVVQAFRAQHQPPDYARTKRATQITSPRRLARSVANRVRRVGVWTSRSLTYHPLRARAKNILLRLVRAWRLRRARYPPVPPGVRTAVFPLHVQPEATIDVEASFHNDQAQVVRWFRQALPADFFLLVKEHGNFLGQKPMSFFRDAAALPGVRLVRHDADTRRLVESCDLVLTVVGTTAYEAGMLGRPAVMCAPSFFSGLSTVRVCTDPTRLRAAVAEALAARHDEAADLAFLDRLLSWSHAGRWSDPQSRPQVTEPANLDLVARAFLRVVRATAAGARGPTQAPGGGPAVRRNP